MDARTYKKLFIRREVQVFKAQDDQEPQEPQKVVQVIKVQGDQGFQEEVGQNFWVPFVFLGVNGYCDVIICMCFGAELRKIMKP